MMYGGTLQSYRKAGDLINRFRHQEQGGTPHRTLHDNTEKEGGKLIDHIALKSKEILNENQFAEDGAYQGNNTSYRDDLPATLSLDKVKAAAEELDCQFGIEDMLENPVCFEDPEKAVRIFIDDVTVKRQKAEREKGGSKEKAKRKYVHNTIAHVENDERRYTLNGHGTKAALCYLTAFILNNALSHSRFQFFTDGHKSLNEAILKLFKWKLNVGIILDWFHLEKKCKEQLSMAMKGRIIRNNVVEEIKPLLWHGRTDAAISLLEGLDEKSIKNKEKVEKLIAYLIRNKPYIPCYAIRSQLGLRNSSNTGEKMNDLTVSERQKHNGMSWSKDGSVALASLTALKRNKEAKLWFEGEDLNFKLAA